MLIGYMRVSKSDGTQAVDLQHDALLAAGVAPERLYHSRSQCSIQNAPRLDGGEASVGPQANSSCCQRQQKEVVRVTNKLIHSSPIRSPETDTVAIPMGRYRQAIRLFDTEHRRLSRAVLDVKCSTPEESNATNNPGSEADVKVSPGALFGESGTDSGSCTQNLHPDGTLGGEVQWTNLTSQARNRNLLHRRGT